MKEITKNLLKSLKYMIFGYVIMLITYICVSIPYFAYIGYTSDVGEIAERIENYPTLEEVATFGLYSFDDEVSN